MNVQDMYINWLTNLDEDQSDSELLEDIESFCEAFDMEDD